MKRNTKVGVSLAVMLVAFCYFDPLSLSFRWEMQQKASKAGLALGYIGGSGMQAFPVDGSLLTQLRTENLENYSGPCRECPGWFSADGRLIVWHHAGLIGYQEPSLLVQTISGKTMWTWVGPLYYFNAVALSPDKSKVAVEVQRYDREVPYNGLQYLILGTDQRVLIEPQPVQSEANDSASVGWSPDSRKIVFSRHGKIITADIGTGQRNEIATGTNPAWSPDGRWISFTSPEHRPMLVNPSDLKQVTLFGGSTITGPIAWSSDSCCISFSDKGRDLETFYLPPARIIVYRVRDGQWFPAMHFGLGGSSNNFGWLYDYKEFLELNNANRAKWEPVNSPGK